jgi:hypothetical protein
LAAEATSMARKAGALAPDPTFNIGNPCGGASEVKQAVLF